MPIVDKRDRNNWYNCIPIKRDPAERWKRFSADQLKGNEVECGCGTLAKIPQIKGLISFKNRENELRQIIDHVIPKDDPKSCGHIIVCHINHRQR